VSLLATCEENGINPEAYAADVLMRVDHHPASKLDELLPQRWVPLSNTSGLASGPSPHHRHTLRVRRTPHLCPCAGDRAVTLNHPSRAHRGRLETGRKVDDITDSARWTAEDGARFLRVSRSWVYDKAGAGLLPSLKIAGAVRFNLATIRAWVAGATDGRPRRRILIPTR